MKKKQNTLELIKTIPSKSGNIKIWFNRKTKQHHWTVTAANGYITSSAIGLNTVQGCMKGIRSVKKTLNACLK